MTKMPTIGVLGLGAMGLGIAQFFAQAGHDVVATDSSAMARENASSRQAELLDAMIKSGKLSEPQKRQILARIKIVNNLREFADAAMVVEAIAEMLEAKQQLFIDLEPHVSDACILATNTSSLSVAQIMKGLKRTHRGLGLHFFNPVSAMKLVELIIPAGASRASVERAKNLVTLAGKQVITCGDSPGFIVNRCARPYYGEALAMLEEGRRPEDIDAAMQARGYRLGPFGLIDLVGADINLAATQSLSMAMGNHPRYHVFESLRTQVASGRLGRKTGQGFIFPAKPGAAPFDADVIALRIEAVLANEAASLIGEGTVSAEQVDTAVKLGLNFPRGPIQSARERGGALIIETLLALESAAPAALKGRYQVQPELRSLL